MWQWLFLSSLRLTANNLFKSTLLFALICKKQNDNPEIVYDEVTITFSFMKPKAKATFPKPTASVNPFLRSFPF